jgi:hypothetical protein
MIELALCRGPGRSCRRADRRDDPRDRRRSDHRSRSVQRLPISGSPGIIVGDDTRTSVRPGRPEPRHPYAATTLARPWEGPAHARQNGAPRGKSGAGSSPTCHDPVNAGSDPDAPTTPYGRVLAMIIRMRLRAGAAIPGHLSTHPLCPPIAVHGGSVRRPQPGPRGVRDLHPPLRRPKALLRAESRSRVTYDHPRSPRLLPSIADLEAGLDRTGAGPAAGAPGAPLWV